MRSDDRLFQLERMVDELRAQLAGMPVRIAESGGGGGSTSNQTKFAVVTEEAGASTHDADDGIDTGTTGKCVLLEESGDDFFPTVAPGDATDDDKIEFRSAHKVKCAVGDIIKLSSISSIEPGSEWEDTKILGELVDAWDYLENRADFGNSKYIGATGGYAAWREFTTASVDVDASGSGECNMAGGVDITIDVDVTGTFVVAPTEP